MGDEQEGGGDAPLQVFQEELHVAPHLGVERGKRFVEQDQLGLAHDRAGKCHALLLAAGELRGVAVQKTAQPHHLQRAHDLVAYGGLGHAPHHQAIADIVGHAHVREQRIVLEDGVEGPLVRGDVGQVRAAEADVAACRPGEAADQPQDRGLARTGRAEDGQELAIGCLQVHRLQHALRAIALLDGFERQAHRQATV